MSVSDPTTGEIFTLRVYKSVDIAADNMWANIYELRGEAGVSDADLIDAIDKVVAFEKAIHQDTAVFRRAVLSTYVPDGAPYNPFSFVSVTLSGNGAVASPVAADTLPLQVCLFLRRDVPTGRAGKLMYRMALEEGEVQGRFGTISLTSPATIATRVNNAKTSSDFVDLLGAVPTGTVSLVMASGPEEATAVRKVQDVTTVGARLVKYNNRYFDVP